LPTRASGPARRACLNGKILAPKRSVISKKCTEAHNQNPLDRQDGEPSIDIGVPQFCSDPALLERRPAVAYAACTERLLTTLRVRAPEKVHALSVNSRRVNHGLLSVGIKLHCLGDENLFDRLIDALGGKKKALDWNLYKRSKAKFCLVLPPVGN